MNRRYAIVRPGRPRMAWDDDVPMLPCLSVDGHEPVDTGLITIEGDAIMRLPEPMGFHHPVDGE